MYLVFFKLIFFVVKVLDIQMNISIMLVLEHDRQQNAAKVGSALQLIEVTKMVPV